MRLAVAIAAITALLSVTADAADKKLRSSLVCYCACSSTFRFYPSHSFFVRRGACTSEESCRDTCLPKTPQIFICPDTYVAYRSACTSGPPPESPFL